MTRSFSFCATICLSLFCQVVVEAGTIFSNLGTGGAFNSASSWTIQEGYPVAFGFTASATETFTSLKLAVGSFNGSTGKAFLATDNSGAPGITLASWSFAVPVSSQGSLVTLDYPANQTPVILSEGTEYWVYLDDATSANYYWLVNSTGYVGPKSGYNGSTWLSVSYGTPAAFEVDGVNTVPEPSTFGMVVISVVCLGILKRSHHNIK